MMEIDGTFHLEIELGNDAMRRPVDLADALHGIGQKVLKGAREGSVRDANGNRVGTFHFEEA